MELSIDNIIIPQAFTYSNGHHPNGHKKYYFKSSCDGKRYGPFFFNEIDGQFQQFLNKQKVRTRHINTGLGAEFRKRELPFTPLRKPLGNLQRSNRRRVYFLLRPPLMITDAPNENRLHNHRGATAFSVHADEEHTVHTVRRFRHIKDEDGDNGLLNLFAGDVITQLLFVRQEIAEALRTGENQEIARILADAVENAYIQIAQTEDIPQDWHVPI